jgi:hypothetical protein
MRTLLFFLLGCLAFCACEKSKASKNHGAFVTSYAATITKGNKTYSTSNYSVYNVAGNNYQWDGLELYLGFPVIDATNVGPYVEVNMWDTAGSAVIPQPVLQFDVPAMGNDFTGYNSPYVMVYVTNTAYSGTGVVSATFTKNIDKTYTGSFTLQATVASSSSPESVSVSISVNFTNLPCN